MTRNSPPGLAPDRYDVLSGSLVRIPPNAKPSLFREEPGAPGQAMVAHALSVRERSIDRETPPVGNPPSEEPPDIDLPVWHSRFQELAGLKLYLDGPAPGATDPVRDMEVTLLQQFGTCVFSCTGELEPRAVHQLEVNEDFQRYLDGVKAGKEAR